MIKKLSLKLLFTPVLVILTVFILRASVCISEPDTLKNAGSSLMISSDSLLIGPDIYVPKNSSVNNEDEVPPFSDVLCRFIVPFKGKVISRYGMRHGRMHMGTDIKLYLGDTVFAAYDGVVSRACRYYGYGNLVVLKHTHGLETYYAHFSKILVNAGDQIKTGQPLGLGGRTGRSTTEHLHFEIRENGKAYNPELVYDFHNLRIRDDVLGKEGLADLITNPKTGERIEITSGVTGHVTEMSAASVAEYVIKAGDSLWKIAKKFNTSVGSLCEHNNLSTHSVLKIGNKIKILK